MSYFNETIEKITEFLKSEAKTDTIMGTEFKLGEFSCIPVMAIGLGFGGGGGEGKATKAQPEGEGSGAGAGMGIKPVGFLVSRGSEIQFISTNSSTGISAAFEKIPDLINKYMEKNK